MIHSLPSHSKIVAAFFFIVIAVSTPIQRWEAFVGFFLVLFITVAAAKIPFTLLIKRALIEIPFIFFALLMPFFGTGERFEVGPLNLYREGLLAGAGIFIKGTLGVITAIVLSTSTQAREILRGLERLRLPSLMVQIASFMLRYVNVISDEMERMAIARQSRGFNATGIKHWKVIATSAAALFIRSYERGERVHLAMLSRGFDGELPHTEAKSVAASAWLTALSIPALALLASLFFRMKG